MNNTASTKTSGYFPFFPLQRVTKSGHVLSSGLGSRRGSSEIPGAHYKGKPEREEPTWNTPVIDFDVKQEVRQYLDNIGIDNIKNQISEFVFHIRPHHKPIEEFIQFALEVLINEFSDQQPIIIFNVVDNLPSATNFEGEYIIDSREQRPVKNQSLSYTLEPMDEITLNTAPEKVADCVLYKNIAPLNVKGDIAEQLEDIFKIIEEKEAEGAEALKLTLFIRDMKMLSLVNSVYKKHMELRDPNHPSNGAINLPARRTAAVGERLPKNHDIAVSAFFEPIK